MSIEGIPEGWLPVRFDYAVDGEAYVKGDGEVTVHVGARPTQAKRLIVRKIEKPKQYRPFANAAEFEPHRDKWMTHPANTCEGCFLVVEYNDKGIFANGMQGLMPYEKAYKVGLRFSDGTPFGVEVTE